MNKSEQNNEKPQVASAVDAVVMWLKCLFGHDWLYDAESSINEQWHRECRRCEKRQHQEYDDGIPIGWENGW